MEAGCEEDPKIGETGEGPSKPKRQMKTPFQLETLEKAYATETHPSEEMRAELSEKLGLSDRQLQMWFCHRRLKDRNNATTKKPRKLAAAAREYSKDPVFTKSEPVPGSDYDSGSSSGSGSSPYGSKELQGVGYVRDGDDIGDGSRYYESPRTIMELRAIACVEAQLGEPLREDGPILGMEFDPLPPDAFGVPIVEEHKRFDHSYDNKLLGRRNAISDKAVGRSVYEYQFPHDQSSIRYNTHGKVAQNHFHDVQIDGPSARAPSSAHGNKKLSGVHGVQGQLLRGCRAPQDARERPVVSTSPGDDDRLQQRDSLTSMRLNSQQNEEARIAREIEAHENRIQKALEKENMLRRKNEDRTRKEMERYDRERRKEEERLMREKLREEERLQREQRKEIERREKFLQKESMRAEKRRQKEEQRREKEAERQKVAIERATARRIAKESMELMEDEQLELMELAATKKGLASIVHLDHDTLQKLDVFRDSLSAFPPETITLKVPFAAQPWVGSEENAGNLLMAWQFLITFADVLGLWPFTLDEFIQAFHDYDSRLLGEIHIALLKLIIKDIEDATRTPATGLGINQSGAVNPEGGHPQIVEGAYAWGFDIQKWQKHLNPLTWPEIFRQLALSAGFGPQLKKRNAMQPNLQECDEVKDCEDIISTLRSGSAAEKALAVMREKGLLLPRRSRHRLTPGTVKFAAFHVLSLEGSNGLTVIDLTDKIQKSGLRDLSTSKTPEASISVALTRDTKLFERIAPSTYRVRSSYRKDPADAEAILSEARKRIRIFENGLLPEENADEVERDNDGERDEDGDEESDGDVGEDPVVDDLATTSSVIKDADQYNPVNELPIIKEGEAILDNGISLENETEKDFIPCPVSEFKDTYCSNAVAEQFGAGEGICDSKKDPVCVEIDESKLCESWIHGLSEGEYSYLSVEERLNALVALIGIANEGNSVRAVLEDRLEAANALKKQMWAEVQLDKSRLKDEFISKVDLSSFTGGRSEAQASAFNMGSQSPWPAADTKNTEASPSLAENQKPLFGLQNGTQNDLSSVPSERTSILVQDPSGVPDNLSQNGYVSRRSRSQLKSYIAQKAEEIYVYRSLPLGQDRRRNRYWQFVASSSRNDPGSGRIFVELNDGRWRLIDSEEAFDALLMSLDARGIRESHLRVMLLKVEKPFKDNVRWILQSAPEKQDSVKNEVVEMDSRLDCHGFGSPSSVVCVSNNDTSEVSSSFRIEIGRNHFEKRDALRRYQEFLKWLSRECFNSFSLCAMRVGKRRSDPRLIICNSCLGTYFCEEQHCFSCHTTFADNLDFSHHAMKCENRKMSDLKDSHVLVSSVPLGIRLLKAFLAYIEASIPSEALQSSWTEDRRTSWGMKLSGASSSEEFLQMLTLLEDVIRRDHLSPEFERTKDLLSLPESSDQDFFDLEHVPVLPWIPCTIAALALRVLELDCSIIYVKPEQPESHGDHLTREDMEPLTKPTTHKAKAEEVLEGDQSMHLKESPGEVGSRRKSNKRGRVGGDRNSRKWQRRSSASRSDVSGGQNIGNRRNLPKQQQGKTRAAQGGSSVRGQRTLRKRRADNKVAKQTSFMGADTVGEGSRKLNEGRANGRMYAGRVEEALVNSDSAEYDENEDENEEMMEYDNGRNWGDGFAGSSNGWNKNSEEEVCEEEEEDVGMFEEEEEEYDELEEENTGEGFEGGAGIRDDAEYGGMEPVENDEDEEEDEEEGSEMAGSEDYSE